MNNNLHELVFVFDQTAAVEKCLNEAVSALKNLIRKQKAVKSDAIVSTVLFGKEYKVLHDRKPITKLISSTKSFSPDGVCPFIDSAIRAIDEEGAKLSALKEEDRPAKVIVTLLVLGRDNASKKHTYDELRRLIEQQRDVYKWKFYLVTDFSIIMEKLGMCDNDTIILKMTDGVDPFEPALKELSEKITACREEALAALV